MNFKRKITNLFAKLIDPEQLQHVLDLAKISGNTAKTTIADNSKLYASSVIHNLQGIKSNIVIGMNTHVRGELLIFRHGGKIQIGDFSFVGEGTKIWSARLITIGNHVLVSHNTTICDTNVHEINYEERANSYKEIISSGHPDKMESVESSSVIIEDYVWINNNVIILKGVTIGRGAIIAAGSVVLKNVDPFTLVAGNPARKIKDLNL